MKTFGSGVMTVAARFRIYSELLISTVTSSTATAIVP